MQQDGRGFLYTTWLTLFWGAISTSWVLDYYASRRPTAPQPLDLGEASVLIAGLWLAVFLAAVMVVIFGWYRRPADAIWSVLLGYMTGAVIRLAFLQDLQPFLNNARSDFNWFWSLVTLRGLPSYSAFLLLIFIGGAVLGITAVILTHLFKERVQLSTLIPDTYPEARVLFGVLAMSAVTLILAVLFRNLLSEFARQAILDKPNDYPAFLDDLLIGAVGRGQFGATEWLILPQTNMIIAALIGFLIGGAYICQSRWSAAVTLFVAMMGHVGIMLLLSTSALLEDPTYAGIDPNRVGLLSFIFFWIGTPLIGGIAAFALHNLRDAFAAPPVHLETVNETE